MKCSRWIGFPSIAPQHAGRGAPAWTTGISTPFRARIHTGTADLIDPRDSRVSPPEELAPDVWRLGHKYFCNLPAPPSVPPLQAEGVNCYHFDGSGDQSHNSGTLPSWNDLSLWGSPFADHSWTGPAARRTALGTDALRVFCPYVVVYRGTYGVNRLR